MKTSDLLALLCLTFGLGGCQGDSNSSRPDPKPTATKTPDPAANKPAGAKPPGPTGTTPTNPEVPAGTTGGLNGAACSATEQAVPTGPTEDSYRACCDQLNHSKSCLDKTHKCWDKVVFPGIEKALTSGTCKKAAASGGGAG